MHQYIIWAIKLSLEYKTCPVFKKFKCIGGGKKVAATTIKKLCNTLHQLFAGVTFDQWLITISTELNLCGFGLNNTGKLGNCRALAPYFSFFICMAQNVERLCLRFACRRSTPGRTLPPDTVWFAGATVTTGDRKTSRVCMRVFFRGFDCDTLGGEGRLCFCWIISVLGWRFN